MILVPPIAPGEVLNYSVDFDELDPDSVVGTPDVTVTGAVKDEATRSGNVVTVVVSGATAGTLIKIAVKVTTTGGLTLRRLLLVPFAEPVSLDQAKQQCKLEADDTDEDELIAGFIGAARKYVEDATGLILVRRALTKTFEDWGECDTWNDRARRGRHLTLAVQPIVSVDTVTYIDPDEVEQTYASPIVRIGDVFTRIYPALGGGWPALSCRGGVTVAYTAGYAEGEVPETAVQAMLLMIAHFYANREAVVAGARAVAVIVPLSAQALCDQLRLARV